MESLTLNPGVGGESIRVLDDGTYLWPAGITAFATSVADPDVVSIVTPTTGLPVRLADGSGYLATLPVSLASVPSHAVTGPLTDAELRASAVPVSLASVPSHAVTNAGTFAVQATQAGTWTVDLGASDNAVLDAIAASLAGTLVVNGSGVTQPVSDAGGSLTVDGTVAVSSVGGTVAVSAASLPLPSGASTAANQTTANASLATLAGAVSGTEVQVDVLTMPTVAVTGTFWQATQPVSGTVTVQDGGGSLTVDSPVGTPAFVRLSDGTDPIATLPVSLASVPSHAVTNAGTFAVQAAQSGTWTVQPGNTANTTAWLVTGTGGSFPVTDSGGSLTVDGSVSIGSALPAGANNIGDVDVLSLPALAVGDNAVGRVKLTDGTDVADILDLTNANPLTVAIVDGSGDQITSFGGGTQYTEGDTDASITGTALLWEDAGNTLRPASAANPLPIGDAGGSLTVDNGGTFAVQAAQSGTWNVTNVSGTVSLPTGAATAAKQPALGTAGTASADVITVQGIASMTPILVNGSGVTQPVSGTVTAELSATDNAVLDAIAASLAGTLTVTGGGGGTEYTEGATDASITGSAILWEDTGDTLRAVSAAKPLPIGDAGGSLTVDGTVAAAQSGAWTVDLGATDNAVLDAIAASVAGTLTVGTHAVTQSGTWTVTGTGGTFPVTDSGGSLTVDAPVGTPVFVRLSDGSSAISTLPVSLASVPSHAVTNAGTFAVQAAQSGTWNVGTVTTLTTCSTVTTLTGGGIAHDSADSGNPHKIGGKAKSSLSAITTVAADDRTDLFADVDGVLLVRQDAPLADNVSAVVAITDGSSTSVIAAQGASVKTYITDVTISNTSATAVNVDLRDGTGGTVKWTFPVPANTAGVVHSFRRPLGFSANTAVAADPSAAASTITVSLNGFKSKV